MLRVVCDHCEQVLWDHPSSCLKLVSEATGGALAPTLWVAPALVGPLLSRPYHFCNLACLYAWAAKQLERTHDSPTC